jgi:hypothetical protein
MHNTAWTETDLNVLRSLYPKYGALGVHESLPHKSVAAIRAQAARLRIRSPNPPKEATEVAWPVPAQDVLQQLDCVVLREWRGPVNAGPLVPTIGRRAA